MASMAGAQVRVWRPADEPRVLLMSGPSTAYAVEPRGEYVFGLVSGRPMRARRGRDRSLVAPGQLVAWDPSGAHSGAPAAGAPWSSRLMVVDARDLDDLVGDADGGPFGRGGLRDPVVADRELADGFRRLHDALRVEHAPSTSRLERDELLASWLRMLVVRRLVRRAAPVGPRAPADGRAVRRALEFLADNPDRNVGLDELAAVAGTEKFRLLRQFRENTGMPPHAFHLASRVRAARRLLETGSTVAEAAGATGFADQSHLHRQFRRSLGITPGQYVRYLRG